MDSSFAWKFAEEPNYNTNIDQGFPYSDFPHQGEFRLLKIPVSLNDLIKHVDYFGEGRVESTEGISGFANCYNVNHQYRLVSSGPDRNKKIPNRIPVLSYTDCDTSAYVKDNSVLTVSVAAERINSSCSKDIARVVNNDLGMVVVFGAQDQSQELKELTTELKKKGMLPYVNATLPNELQGLTLYDGHVVFFNSNDTRTRKFELYNNVVSGNYESAVNISKSFDVTNVGDSIDVIIQKLIGKAPRNVVVFAYKLWHSGAQDFVRKHFPKPYQYIMNEDAVTIVNTLYKQALKLDSKIDPKNNDRAASGDSRLPRTSNRLSWKFLPVCKGNDLSFELYNIDCNMFMRMDDAGAIDGDKQCWGSMRSEEDPDDSRYEYYLEPILEAGDDAFLITNVQHKQQLKLQWNPDDFGDRLLWGNNHFAYPVTSQNRWRIEKWSSC